MNNILLMKDYRLQQLQESDLSASLALLTMPGLAAAAGMQLSADAKMQQWAVSIWLNQQYLWGIFKADQLVGLIAIFPREDDWQELGYLLVPAVRGQGLMKCAVKSLIAQLKPRKLMAETSRKNAASMAILKAAGFEMKDNPADQFVQWFYQKSS